MSKPRPDILDEPTDGKGGFRWTIGVMASLTIGVAPAHTASGVMVAICIGVGALLVYVVDRQLLKLIGFRRLMLIERGLLLIGLLWAIYYFYTGLIDPFGLES